MHIPGRCLNVRGEVRESAGTPQLPAGVTRRMGVAVGGARRPEVGGGPRGAGALRRRPLHLPSRCRTSYFVCTSRAESRVEANTPVLCKRAGRGGDHLYNVSRKSSLKPKH